MAPRHYFKRFGFRVEIDGIASAAFSKAGPLAARVAMSIYRQGGSPIAIKTPAEVEFPDIVLERGATWDVDLFNWFRDVAGRYQQTGKEPAGYERHLDIVQLDRDGDPAARWSVYRAWPKEFVAGDWDNNAEEVVIERAVLAVRYWDLTRMLERLR